MSIDLTPIIQAIIALIAALIAYRLIPWIKARTTESQQANLRAVVKTLVFAAEQMYGAGNGHDKLNYVKMRLSELGFNVDVDEIEAAVCEYLNRGSVFDMFNPNADVPPLEEWSLEQLDRFCDEAGIPTAGCVLREDYIRAIKGEEMKPPEDEDN